MMEPAESAFFVFPASKSTDYERKRDRRLGKGRVRHFMVPLVGKLEDSLKVYELRKLDEALRELMLHTRTTRFSKKAVERYIRDFENMRMLTQISTEPVRISQLSRLNVRVVRQYLDLLPKDPRGNGKRPAEGSNEPPAGLPEKTEAHRSLRSDDLEVTRCLGTP